MGWYNELWDAARFLNIFGSSQVDGPWRYCWIPECITQTAVFGDTTLTTPTTACQLGVLWGTGHAQSSGIKWRVEKEIPHIIVVNPIPNEEVDYADIWLPVRPASDAALAMAWLKIIIDEGLYDKKFVKLWTSGFDQLKERVKDSTPEWAAEKCWVSKNDIIDSARMYGTIKPAALIWGTAIGHTGHNAQAIEHARICLRAITGNLAADGGDSFRHIHPITNIPRLARYELQEMLPDETMKLALGSNKFRLSSWQLKGKIATGMLTSLRNASLACFVDSAIFREKSRLHIKGTDFYSNDSPITALIATDAIANSVAGSHKIFDALMNLELSVHIDSHWNPAMFISDYALPATHYYERPSISWLEHGNVAGAGAAGAPKSVPGKWDRHTYYDLWKALGERLGQEGYWPWKDLEDFYEYCTQAGLRMSWEEFSTRRIFDIEPIRHKEYEKNGWLTRSGKVELYSSVMKDLNYDPLPNHKEPLESPYATPDLYKEYPIIATMTNRKYQYTQASFRAAKVLREPYPYPYVQMNPKLAQKIGVKENDWVWIETTPSIYGGPNKVLQRAFFKEKLDPRYVCLDYGWWYPELPWEIDYSKIPNPKFGNDKGCAFSQMGPYDCGGQILSNANNTTTMDLDHLSDHNGCWVDTALLAKVYKAEDKDVIPELKKLTYYQGRLDRGWKTPPEPHTFDGPAIAAKTKY